MALDFPEIGLGRGGFRDTVSLPGVNEEKDEISSVALPCLMRSRSAGDMPSEGAYFHGYSPFIRVGHVSYGVVCGTDFIIGDKYDRYSGYSLYEVKRRGG